MTTLMMTSMTRTNQNLNAMEIVIILEAPMASEILLQTSPQEWEVEALALEGDWAEDSEDSAADWEDLGEDSIAVLGV